MSDPRRIYSESNVPVLRTLPSGLFSQNGTILSSRQLSELNASVLQYLHPILTDLPEVYEAVEKALGNYERSVNLHSKSNKAYGDLMSIDIPDNYLQKKWSTVLRLQRNLLELETRNKALEDRNQELEQQVEILRNTPQTNQSSVISFKFNWIPSVLKTSLLFHTSPITAVAIHPYNPYLVTASQDGMMVFWNMLDFSEPVGLVKNAHSKSINRLFFQPKSSLLASCSSDQTIKIWDLSDINNVTTPTKILTGHEHIVSSVVIPSSNPNVIFSSSRDNTIKVWDLLTGWALHSISGHSDWVRAIDVVGDYVLSGSSDTSVRLTHWPSQTGVGLCLGHEQVVEDVKFLPDVCNQYLDNLGTSRSDDTEYEKLKFKYAISCGRDKLIKIWKLPLPEFNALKGHPVANPMNPYGECIKEIRGHKSWVRDLQVHYNGKYIISCSDDQTIKFWDLETLSTGHGVVEPVKVLQGHESFVNCISIASPRGEEATDDNLRCYLVSGGADSRINVWV